MLKLDVRVITVIVVGALLIGFVGQAFAEGEKHTTIEVVYTPEKKEEYKKGVLKNFVKEDENNPQEIGANFDKEYKNV